MHCQLRSGEHSLTVFLVHGGGYLLEVSDMTLGIQISHSMTLLPVDSLGKEKPRR